MRALIFFVITIILFLFAITTISFLLPSRIMVTRNVTINAPQQKVKAQVDEFANWQNWFPPLQDKSVRMVEKSKNSVVLNDSSGREIRMEMHRSLGDTTNISFESIASSKIDYQFIVVSHNADSTRVTLNVFTTFKWYPWQKLKGIVLDKMTGPMYEEILRNLKRAVEANQP